MSLLCLCEYNAGALLARSVAPLAQSRGTSRSKNHHARPTVNTLVTFVFSRQFAKKIEKTHFNLVKSLVFNLSVNVDRFFHFFLFFWSKYKKMTNANDPQASWPPPPCSAAGRGRTQRRTRVPLLHQLAGVDVLVS